jgi:hypothetical protein
MTTKTELLKIIRRQCVTCCGGSYAEVEACQGGKKTTEYTTCHLHPFRFGTDPFAKVSEAKREQGKRLAESRKKKKESPVILA